MIESGTDPAAEAIRFTPLARTREMRAGWFHGRTLLVSIAGLALAPAGITGLFLFGIHLFLVLVVMAGVAQPYMLLFALPFDAAKKSRPAEWILSARGVEFRVPNAGSKIDWAAFQCLIVGRQALLLHARNSSGCFILPRRCLEPDDLARVAAWATARGVRVRRSWLSRDRSPLPGAISPVAESA